MSDRRLPTMARDVSNLPFVYWSPNDRPKSRHYSRVIAFSPNDGTTQPESIEVGGPITGHVVSTGFKYETDQIIGRNRDRVPSLKARRERFHFGMGWYTACNAPDSVLELRGHSYTGCENTPIPIVGNTIHSGGRMCAEFARRAYFGTGFDTAAGPSADRLR